MGFLDKVKNLFTEEEEVFEEPIKKEVIKVEIPAPEVAKPQETPVVVAPAPREEPKREEVQEKKKPAPVFFDDKDFENIERRVAKPVPKKEEKKEEPKKAVSAYQMSKQRTHEERKSFKPSPIISPVYGVLDKNYHKNDIVPKRETRMDKLGGELTIDEVRNRAFGTLEDEIDATLFEDTKIEVEDTKTKAINGLEEDIFKDLEIDMEKEPAVEEETIDTHDVIEDDAEFQLDEPVDTEEPTDNLVGEAMNMDLTEEEEKPVKKKRQNREVKEEMDDLEDSDLFNLIDSMYEKRDEDDE